MSEFTHDNVTYKFDGYSFEHRIYMEHKQEQGEARLQELIDKDWEDLPWWAKLFRTRPTAHIPLPWEL